MAHMYFGGQGSVHLRPTCSATRLRSAVYKANCWRMLETPVKSSGGYSFLVQPSRTELEPLNVNDALVRGYFPRELPPVFSTLDFGNTASGLKAPIPGGKWTKPLEINLARPGSLRRRLAVPNPFSQLQLLKECSAAWPILEAHLKNSSISLSRPMVAPLSDERALTFKVPFSDRPAERLSRMWRSRFTVRADISDCYGSIYTHSLEWALHGKAASKANIGKGKSKPVGSKLDTAVRNGQDGQTKGIPVGPDSSLLLAEIILCSIDAEMQRDMPQVFGSAIRLMDDMEFFAQTRAEAEDFLTTWDSKLHTYGLALNPRKTEIVEGPVPHDFPWRVDLSQFSFRSSRSDKILANDIRSFFARAFGLARLNPDDAVLSYAIARVGNLDMESASWSAFQASMLAAVTVDPSCLRLIAREFSRAKFAGMSMDNGLIEKTLNQLCNYHAPFEHGSEVAWSLHILMSLGLKLDSKGAKLVAQMQDNCCLLLLVDFVKSNSIFGHRPNLDPIEERAQDPEALQSEDWLLGYEMARNGWSGGDEFKKSAHWNELLNAKVAFFNPPSVPGSWPKGSKISNPWNGGPTSLTTAAKVPAPPTPRGPILRGASGRPPSDSY
jgi:hypothetical protein